MKARYVMINYGGKTYQAKPLGVTYRPKSIISTVSYTQLSIGNIQLSSGKVHVVSSR